MDVTIITGQFKSSSATSACQALLLMRFHDIDNAILHPNKIEKLYSETLKECSHGGFESQRSGGSSGRISVPDPNFFRFINSPGNLPRKGKGVKFERDGNKWVCHYIQKDSGIAKKYPYTCPQVGGAFSLPPHMLHSHPFLVRFAELKMESALILQVLNENPDQMNMQPISVDQEIVHISEARKMGKVILEDRIIGTSKKRKRNKISRRTAVVRGYNTMNKYTNVSHSVGMHLDVVGTPSLENKACFIVQGRGPSMGRGGAGSGKFVFALLDWGIAKSPTREVALAVGLPYNKKVTGKIRDQIDAAIN